MNPKVDAYIRVSKRWPEEFQEASTGSVNEYAQLRPEFAPELLDALAAWLADQLSSR